MRNGKHTQATTPVECETSEEDEDALLAAHMARLLKRGRVIAGTGGPAIRTHELPVALRRLNLLARQWLAVTALDAAALEDMDKRAQDLMSRHPLQSGDALQLAAALTFFEPVHRRGFVVIDRGLAHAA